jgi:hypothetical protein
MCTYYIILKGTMFSLVDQKMNRLMEKGYADNYYLLHTYFFNLK